MSTITELHGIQDAAAVSPHRISIPDLERFVVEVLTRLGVSPSDARTTADVLVTTDCWGVFTHGTKSLNGYVRRIKAGGLSATKTPEIIRQGPGWAMLNGNSTLGMVGGVAGMKTAIQKARATGIGYAGVNNTCHFGAAGYYAAMAAKEGLIGLAMANDMPSMTAPGSSGRVMGNNPFAFAAPAEPGRPILLDMALSTVAGGKVVAAQALGKPIPNTWIVDQAGVPTTDAAAFLAGGSLQPMAGHKGYGLALMVEALAGLLTGAKLRNEILAWMIHDHTKPTGHGAAFIAVDIASMISPEEYQKRMLEMVADIRQSPKAAGSDRIYMPGEIEWEKRDKAMKEGIVLPADVVATLQTLAHDSGVELKGATKV